MCVFGFMLPGLSFDKWEPVPAFSFALFTGSIDEDLVSFCVADGDCLSVDRRRLWWWKRRIQSADQASG